MNPRAITAVVGTLTLLLGLAALFYPERILGLIGLAVANTAHPAAALGEVRATYGGIFVVLAVFTFLSAVDPGRHRGRLMLIGMVWLGAFGGRLFGVVRDGHPGFPGWLGLAFELGMGGALLLAAQMAESTVESTVPPVANTAQPAGEPT
jgi:drug/metabolite transporter superfamily protein YnfA